jgi:hypothetical protein
MFPEGLLRMYKKKIILVILPVFFIVLAVPILSYSSSGLTKNSLPFGEAITALRLHLSTAPQNSYEHMSEKEEYFRRKFGLLKWQAFWCAGCRQDDEPLDKLREQGIVNDGINFKNNFDGTRR